MFLFEDDVDGVGEVDGVVGGVGWEEEYVVLVDDDVFEGVVIGGVDDFEEYGVVVLVELFGGLVDVVVGVGVGVVDDYDGEVFVVDVVVVDGGFEEVGVFFKFGGVCQFGQRLKW